VKQVLSGTVVPYLKSRFAPATPQKQMPSATPAILTPWAQATLVLAAALPPASLFPLVDLWRLALLDPAVGTRISSSSPSSDPIKAFLDKCSADSAATQQRNYTLTLLRLLSNAFSTPVLSRRLLAVHKASMTRDVLVPSLLNDDLVVRTAAASLAFNVAGWVQRGRVGRLQVNGQVNGVKEGMVEEEEDEEWEVEMVSAIVEAIEREGNSEDVGGCRLLFLLILPLCTDAWFIFCSASSHSDSRPPPPSFACVRCAARAAVGGSSEPGGAYAQDWEGGGWGGVGKEGEGGEAAGGGGCWEAMSVNLT
jgi:PUL domain